MSGPSQLLPPVSVLATLLVGCGSGPAPARPQEPSATVPPAAPAPAPTLAPLLDAARGQRALVDYRAALADLCRSIQADPAGGPGLLERAGLAGADATALCVNVEAAGEALASGAFEAAGADEVVLAVPSGADRAAGDHALALMRAEGAHYRIQRYLAPGNDRYEARARIVRPSGPDVLLICNHHGQQGVYLSTCGVLGRGHFGQGGAGEGADDEIELVRETACGPGASIRLGEITLDGSRLHGALLLSRHVREPADPEERASDLCSREVSAGQSTLGVDWELEADRLRRVTPIPAELAEILGRY